MSIEDELLALAREREAETQNVLSGLVREQPHVLGRQLRAYLDRQVDYSRIKRTNEKIPHLVTAEGGLEELACTELEFSSGARLAFKIQLEKAQRGCLVKRFQFHLHLPHQRGIAMVRIHLNAEAGRDPLRVPRCHLHIDNSEAHVPFPIMNPRLILHLICEHIEPDFGT